MNTRKWTITITLCITIVAALALFKVMEIRAAIAFAESFPEQSETVEIAVVSTTNFTSSINTIGEMVAPQRLDLRNEIAGEIAAVNFDSGKQVNQGDILLQLDISVERANLKAAEAKAVLARSVYLRTVDLLKSKAASDDQLDRANAELATSQAEIEALKSTIEKKTLRSPFNGRAGLHDLEVGQFLTGNSLITTLIGQNDFIWVDFKVPQFYRRLQTEDRVEISPIGQKTINQKNKGFQLIATVIAEYTILNAGSRSRWYRAEVANPSEFFSANTIVNVKVAVSDQQRLAQIPVAAIQYDPLGQFVFILVEDKDNNGFRAVRRPIEVKVVGEELALIESGLEEGDRIAAEGAFKLQEGLLVFSSEKDKNPVNNKPAEELEFSTTELETL